MKKLLSILLSLFIVLTIAGCNSKQVDAPTIDEPVIQKTDEKEKEILGGYNDVEDGTITDELKDIFNKALEGLTGASYEPVELVSTQVVSDINYRFLANGTKTTNPITKGTYYITIYKDLNDNVKLLDIEVIEEKQEEKHEDKKTESNVNIENMSFWVVFYDQYDNELQREALKYGTVPEYKSWLPEGFEKWVYKKSGKDVGSFKSITGNTYFKAVCHEVSNSSDSPAPKEINYFYIKNTKSDPSTISLDHLDDTNNSRSAPVVFLQYSFDKKTWNDFNSSITLNENQKVYFKATTTNGSFAHPEVSDGGGYNYFDFIDGEIELGGSIMTLLDPTDTLRDLSNYPSAFAYLFRSKGGVPTSKLKSVSKLSLPATKLGNHCYMNLFRANRITDVPELPAMELADYCYESMFYQCMSLNQVPNLPATVMKKGCYLYMFNNCSSLTVAPELNSTSLAIDCYSGMFQKTKITSAPYLPATELKEGCYSDMFSECSQLNYIRVGFGSFDGLPTNATNNWVSSLTIQNGTFVWTGYAVGPEDNEYFDDSKIPWHWTVEQDPACLAKGTLITMADGSQKPIELLKHGDDIKVFNHDTGKLTNSKILDYWHYDYPKSGLITLHFTNDINVNVVLEHSFFNKEENTYVILNKDTINNYIGKHFYNADNDSWETLISTTYSNEMVDTYYLATENHYNCIAEGMLTVEDGLYQVLCNTFEYDNNMRINKFKKLIDIIHYGTFSYNDFDYLTKDEFNSHKLGYLKLALGKGIISEDDLKLLEEIWTVEKEILEEN